MIIDAFLFHDEIDMLEFRLQLLGDHIDKFVIVEADHTFSGQPKPFHYWDNRERFRRWWPKILHWPIKLKPLVESWGGWGDKPTSYQPDSIWWRIERLQRNAIGDALTGFPAPAALLMGDVDEIPSRKAIEWASEWLMWDSHMALRQHFFYYDLTNLRCEPWNGTTLSTVEYARKTGTQALRDKRCMIPWMESGGWHLSCFGGAEAIQRKIGAFSHQEFNRDEFKDAGHIAACLASGADLYNRGTQTQRVGCEFFPSYFSGIAEKYPWGIEPAPFDPSVRVVDLV